MGASKQLHQEFREQEENNSHEKSMKILPEIIKERISFLRNQFANGDKSVLDVFIDMGFIKSNIEECLVEIKKFQTENIDKIIEEVQEYPEGHRGVKFRVTNGRKTFDYKHIPEWQDCYENLKGLEHKYKTAFEAKQKNIMVADNGGEEIIMPKIKYSASSVSISPIK